MTLKYDAGKYSMGGLATKVRHKEYVDTGFEIGERYKIIYCDRQFLGLETKKGNTQLIDLNFIRDMSSYAEAGKWTQYLGKTISWVHKDNWDVVLKDDACGKCSSMCRSDKGKCGLYEERGN